MPQAVIFEIIIILVLILINGFFSMSEMALVSARKTLLQQWANQGNRQARRTLNLTQSPNRFLSTVQVAITLVGILSGAFGGVTIAEELAVWLFQNFGMDLLTGKTIGLSLIVLIITFFTLIFGELVPKRMALNSPEKIALWVTGPVQTVSVIVHPIVNLLSISTETFASLLGMKPRKETTVSSEEIKILVEEGVKEGLFPPVEEDLMKRVLRVGNQQVEAIMTPRTDIYWLDINDPPGVFLRKIKDSTFIRFLVCDGALDKIIGVLYIKDVLNLDMNAEGFMFRQALRRMLQVPLYVPGSIPAFSILEQFRDTRMHVAVVVDGNGSVRGLVSLNNLMLALTGQVFTAGSAREYRKEQVDEATWVMEGLVSTEELKEALGIISLPQDKSGLFTTLGGFITTYLGRLPVAGESFQWENLEFTVLEMVDHRVSKVRITRNNQEE